MRRTLTRGLVLVPLLIGSPVVAQVTPQQVPEPTTDGRSLGMPHHQQQANDAMNTEGGRAGRDEPGAHAPTSDVPVFKNGVFDVPDGERIAPSTIPERSKAQRP
jgi:hypothetical protein